jgi:uncharacterized protein YecT (DUF1311 family)
MSNGVSALGLFLAAVVACGSVVHAADQDDLQREQQEFQQVDAQLNQSYQVVMGQLDPVAQASLKSVQRAWIAFKEADFGVFTALTRGTGENSTSRYEISEESDQSSALRVLGRSYDRGEALYLQKRVHDSQGADQILNSSYRQVMGGLPPELSGAEKSAQVAWIRFRDLYCRLDATLKGGISDDSVLRDLTLRRAAQLNRYLIVQIKQKFAVSADADDPYANLDVTPVDPPSADPFRFAN